MTDRRSGLDENENWGVQKQEKDILMWCNKRHIMEIEATFAKYCEKKVLSTQLAVIVKNLVSNLSGRHYWTTLAKLIWINDQQKQQQNTLWVKSGSCLIQRIAQQYGGFWLKTKRNWISHIAPPCSPSFEEKASDFNNPAYVVCNRQFLHDIVDYTTFDPNIVSCLKCFLLFFILINFLILP